MRFSEREGINPAQKVAQVEGMDDDLRNSLWSVIHAYYWCMYKSPDSHNPNYDPIKGSILARLYRDIWFHFLKLPVDEIPEYQSDVIKQLREKYFKAEWWWVYEFIEFIKDNGFPHVKQNFEKSCNEILQRECSGYRFIDGIFARIAAEEEIKSIEEALERTSTISGVNAHLRSAIEHMSNKTNPNHRNSIKESISALEAFCQKITGNKKATLGQALDLIEKTQPIHGALRESFQKLYGYTSDADGIRHGMLEESTLTYNDSKYMLVACTAFINYIQGKIAAAEMGVES